MPDIRYGIAIAASLFALASPAFAQQAAKPEQRPESCLAALRNKPSLDAKKLSKVRFRMVTNVIGWERDRSGKQIELTHRSSEVTADLKDGVALLIHQGGCETYSNAYEFTFSRPAPANADGRYWLRQASELLREVAPANVDDVFKLEKLAGILARQAQDPKVARSFPKEILGGELETGSDVPTYSVELEQRSGKMVLTVGYYIPL